MNWMPKTLGPCTIDSPLGLSSAAGDEVPDYVADDRRVLVTAEITAGDRIDERQAFERGGPRARIFFDPGRTTAALLTAGGLCPGINNVIRSLVLQLHHKYGVARILGFRYGFAGLDPASGLPVVPLEPDTVAHIHGRGGTMLGTSRGQREVGTMVDTLVREGVHILFVIGGDGSMRGAHAIAEEIARRGLDLAIIGVPKTIDNDIAWVDKTFGFDTAVSVARSAIDAAHTEASSALGGIGLVRLMGREAGFIAAHATLASRDVNACLVPEVRFTLDGPRGLLAYLEWRLVHRGHAVVVVAEGCGRMLVERDQSPRDPSGNLKLSDVSLDIGRHFEQRINAYFRDRNVPVTLKYVDPSYMVRGVPANAMDAIYCDELARMAVHAAMAGKTDMMVGRWHGTFTNVPLARVVAEKRRIDPDHELWLAVTETTGQPQFV